jgi:hypothetical protein
MESVLAASKSLHPEMTNVVDSMLASIELIRKDFEGKTALEKAEDESLTHVNASYNGIRKFLARYGPSQIIHDRQRSIRRVRLPRTVYLSGSALHAADALVRRASEMAGNLRSSFDELSEILVDTRSALPHPMWTTRHDAVLIHAISKHGWISEDLAVRAIAQDNSLQWGSPFGPDESGSPVNNETHQIMACAGRVVDIFTRYSNLFREIKSFNQQYIITAFGLQRSRNNDGSEVWLAEGDGATHVNQINTFDLPPKKQLVKRAKTMLSLPHLQLKRESIKLVPVHNYTKLDQKYGSNVFLAELLRAILKESTTSIYMRDLFMLASEEARRHAASLPLQDISQPISPAESLRRIAEHIDEAGANFKKAVTQSKNIIRVILGEEVVKPRNNDEGIFPAKKLFAPLQTFNVDSKASRNQTLQKASNTSGQKAIALCRDRLLQHYKNSDGTSANSQHQDLELTEIETIILSCACSLGVPVWNEDWKSVLSGESMTSSNKSSCLTWEKFGSSMAQIAKESLDKVSEKLIQVQEKWQKLDKHNESAKTEDRRLGESALEFANYNFKCKEMVAIQAREYTSEPETLAKKVIMLLEKLRCHMPAVIVSALTMRSDNGLGSKVLWWFRNELLKWATSLDLLDDNGQPFAFTAVEYLDELDESERITIEVSSLFNKKSSRSVFSQTAMLSRLRSIYTASVPNFDVSIFKVRNTLAISRDMWLSQPTTWNNICDAILVKRLMEIGFSDSLLKDAPSSQNKVSLMVPTR